MNTTPRWKIAITNWLGFYPTVTVVTWALSPSIASLPLPLKTLCLTLVVVPTMVWVVHPIVQKIFKNWLKP
jgi:uncharacterized protein